MKNYIRKGQILIQVIVIGTIATLMIGGLVGWAGVNMRLSSQSLDRERAIQLAEAGIEYYRWHLAHAPTDFQDGTGAPGPYIHDVKDRDGNTIGTFSLDITPPLLGSTKVTIDSTGRTSTSSPISRTIRVVLGIPSLAKFAVVANDNMRFGESTEVYGPIHSNQGIRFDGYAHNIVTSAVASYDEPDHSGAVEFGVHTHVSAPPASSTVNSVFRPDEAPPSAVPDRPDVFGAGRSFPVPATDFTGLTNNLSQIKSAAQSDGVYLAPSGSQGYQIILKTNDTFDVYRVTSQTATPNRCTNSEDQVGWGTWSVNNRTFVANHPIPANGLVFVEDHAWVEGQIESARITIAAGRFPDNSSTRANIIVNKDLLYTYYDGQDALALMAQGHIHVGLISEDDLRIDGALVAQNGRVGRFYYIGPSGGQNKCAPYNFRETITLYGMIASNVRYGFAYSDGNGYQIRNIIYDANLLYSPPPSFPLTSDQYEVLSWEEI